MSRRFWSRSMNSALGCEALMLGSAAWDSLSRRRLTLPCRPFALESPRAQSGACTPLRPGRYKVVLTARQQLHDKLQQAQHLLRHRIPDGDPAAIVERAVELLLERTLKQRFAKLEGARVGASGAEAHLEARGRDQEVKVSGRKGLSVPTRACRPGVRTCARSRCPCGMTCGR